MNGIKSFFRFLINTNILVSFCVSSLALSSELLFYSSNYQISKFVFFATLFTYNFQRIVRIKRGIAHKRKQWTLNNLNLVYSLIVIGTIGSFYHFFLFNRNTQILIFITGIVSILYPLGLRKIPFCKIFIISFTWTISTMILLISENNILLNTNTYLHVISRFLFVLAITIPFDIRDIKYDHVKLKTIPIIVGITKAKAIAIIAIFALQLVSSYQFVNYNLNFGYFIAIILSCIFSAILIRKSEERKSDFFFSFWVESLSIVFYLFLAITTLFF
jgi:4-hydroxybenzoate polyprenyltransferase